MTTVEPSSQTRLPSTVAVSALAAEQSATGPMMVIGCNRLGMRANLPAARWPFSWFLRR